MSDIQIVLSMAAVGFLVSAVWEGNKVWSLKDRQRTLKFHHSEALPKEEVNKLSWYEEMFAISSFGMIFFAGSLILTLIDYSFFLGEDPISYHLTWLLISLGVVFTVGVVQGQRRHRDELLENLRKETIDSDTYLKRIRKYNVAEDIFLVVGSSSLMAGLGIWFLQLLQQAVNVDFSLLYLFMTIVFLVAFITLAQRAIRLIKRFDFVSRLP